MYDWNKLKEGQNSDSKQDRQDLSNKKVTPKDTVSNSEVKKETERKENKDSGQTFSSPSLEAKIDKLNENLNFLKRYIVLITIALFVLMSWTALGATGSWWKWFAFFIGN